MIVIIAYESQVIMQLLMVFEQSQMLIVNCDLQILGNFRPIGRGGGRVSVIVSIEFQILLFAWNK